MKFNMCYVLMTAVIMLTMSAALADAGPLYEQYLNTPRETLQDETSQMGRKLKNTFNENRIRSSRQRIDFADYYANFKKLILYGAKLANYADYEENLAFARDRELFKGLSSVGVRGAGASAGSYNQKAFIDQKYEKTKANVAEEIDTYTDLIVISLNACEIMTANDLSGFSTTRESQDTIRRYMDESEAYHAYSAQRKRLEGSWPELASRIEAQVTFWKAQGRKMPEDPIIDPNLTGAIL